MREQYKELIGQMNDLADWVEKTNNLHAFSAPRWAAMTIERLEEENHQMRLQLNKRDITFTERLNRIIGYVKLWWYLTRKRLNTL